ncbi:MAG: NAD(P)-dependent oxidoreductase [Pseudomonadota bacterium]
MKYKVLCTDGFSDAGLNELKKYPNLDVTYEASLSHEDLLKKIGSYNALIVRSASQVSKDVIEHGSNLRIIVRAGVGTDNIDLEAATEQGILVANAPAGNTVSTAELTFAMLMALARHIPQAACTMAAGKWEKKKFKGEEIYHKTLGIIGMGRIGREVARRAQAFEMQVMGYDPYLTKEQFESIKVKPATVEEICQQADYITVHTPFDC